MNFANNHFPLAARRAETSLSVTLALLTGILVAVAPATGATTEDQHLLADGQFNAAVTSYQGWGQTFTVGLSGLLTRVDLQLGRQTGTSGPLQVELRKTSGGLPDLTPPGSTLQHIDCRFRCARHRLPSVVYRVPRPFQCAAFGHARGLLGDSAHKSRYLLVSLVQPLLAGRHLFRRQRPQAGFSISPELDRGLRLRQRL